MPKHPKQAKNPHDEAQPLATKYELIDLMVDLTGYYPNEVNTDGFVDEDRKPTDESAYQIALMIFDMYYREKDGKAYVDYPELQKLFIALQRYYPTRTLTRGYGKAGWVYEVEDPRLEEGKNVFWLSASYQPDVTLKRSTQSIGTPRLRQYMMQVVEWAEAQGLLGVWFEPLAVAEARMHNPELPYQTRTGYCTVKYRLLEYTSKGYGNLYEYIINRREEGHPVINAAKAGMTRRSKKS